MQEEFEFRILEEHAHRLFSSDEGKRGILARTIKISGNDPRFPLIGDIDREFKQRRNGSFFYGWSVCRNYSAEEIASAELFHLIVNSSAYFEPAGEDCGTVYDEDLSCSICSAGGSQNGPLYLDINRIPRRKDIAKTIAGEVVVSQRLVDLLVERCVTGIAFHPVRRRRTTDIRPTGWHQLDVLPPNAEIVQPTRVGITPFDDDLDGEYRCTMGDTIGFNLLSEITISAASRGEKDVVATRQFIGHRAGVLRPEKSILASPKVRQIFEENKIKGCRFEIAHLA